MDFHAAWSWFSSWVTQAVITTGAAAWIAKNVVEHQQGRQLEKLRAELQKDLEDAKSDHQKEIERLRHLLSSRVSKIHEKEFEVLPEAWRKIHELHGWILHALDLTFKPLLRELSDDELEEFMRTAPA
jgi:uncharacterized protein YPO0396